MGTLDKRFQGISKLVKESKPGFRNKPEVRKREFRCYTCEEEGHMARNCPNKENVDPNKKHGPSEN